ncbi:MAG: 30S ribosomal protein S6 [Acholeplasmataceae bacterium]|nr:30S ribosomal protein S6 [Acholeplasmataceae bacterium]HOA63793.1 30S ribosomal protein S6 [Bacilli bacterium]HPT88819.1 30S ribosomal protein S6 [Bacilli bacterium]HQA19255.1 30S ribosomal protein S6 [Bacilli bacterium]HQD91787.1 30S ribosomal protein S6 [Bacilli bacterium]
MRKYEGMYIIRPSLSEEQIKAIIEEINAIFTTRGSEKVDVNEWGMRELAYEIDNETKGYYVVFNVEATPEAVAEYNRICNIREDILRHIIIKE